MSPARISERALGKARPDADPARGLHRLVAARIDAGRLLEVTQADLLHLEGMRQPGGAQANHHGVGRQPQRLLVRGQRFGEAALLMERLRLVAQRGELVVQGVHGERSGAPRGLAGDYGPGGAAGGGACGEDAMPEREGASGGLRPMPGWAPAERPSSTAALRPSGGTRWRGCRCAYA